MASLPNIPNLFLDGEKAAFGEAIADIASGEASVFALRCRNLRPSADLAETIAAAFLLTNAILMARSRRPIVKLITLGVEDENLRYSYANNFRALFASEFSSLENVGRWHDFLEARQHIDVGALEDTQKAVDFFRHAGISDSATSAHRATVYTGIEGVPATDSAGAQFQFEDANIYAPRIVGAHGAATVALKSVFLADGVKVRTGRKGQNVVIELDCTRASEGIGQWLAHIERILALDFYRLGV
ncbi:hypothetical protein [Parasphingopyxis marina]|uniref:Uncharacterized protein n=1 Tax=Parasphingopyxis marina TaxID=2761622 RepID=A0A842I263_9SPHN|nr:hypothetical protein [Parasphingopyxis marina]MBC2779067.1 hypothetical protein [Parasphingopyxis marina]